MRRSGDGRNRFFVGGNVGGNFVVENRAVIDPRVWEQRDYRVRLDWGAGAVAVAAACRYAVVVDVLSFTTCVSVAADAGIEVFPYAMGLGPGDSSGVAESGPDPQAYAARHRAVAAVGRSGAGPGQVSLSPASIRAAGAGPNLRRIVLPSPNGSTLSFALAASGARTYAASLRNAAAVGDHLAGVLADRSDRDPTASVGIVAAGERWPDGALRPAVEDLWGAGAVVTQLVRAGIGPVSPEARAAALAYQGICDDVGAALHACASGRELDARGFGGDVDIAAELDASRVVPELRDLAYRPAP